MEIFFVREKKEGSRKGAWVAVEARDMASAKRKYVKSHNAKLKIRYKKDPDIVKYYHLVQGDLVVRKTPPPRGDIYTGKSGNLLAVYVPRKVKPFRGRSGIKNSLQDKQLDLLITMSQRLQKPLMYSNDLYVHDKEILKKYRPNKFIWSVRPTGTDLYPLDTKGKALPFNVYKGRYLQVKVDTEQSGYEKQNYFLIDNTSIKEITGKSALKIMTRHFKKAYPKMILEI